MKLYSMITNTNAPTHTCDWPPAYQCVVKVEFQIRFMCLTSEMYVWWIPTSSKNSVFDMSS